MFLNRLLVFFSFSAIIILLLNIFVLTVSNLPRHEASSGVKVSNWCQWLQCKLSEAGLEDLTCLVTSLTVIPSFSCRVIWRQLLCIALFPGSEAGRKVVLFLHFVTLVFIPCNFDCTLIRTWKFKYFIVFGSCCLLCWQPILTTLQAFLCIFAVKSSYFQERWYVSSVRAFLFSCLPGRN